MTAIGDIQSRIIREIDSIQEPFQRQSHIVALAGELPEVPDAVRSGEHLVKGCQARVWLHSWVDDGVFHMEADSDTLVVKGVLALLFRLFEGQPAEDVAVADIELLEHLQIPGFDDSRMRGLSGIVASLQEIAGQPKRCDGNRRAMRIPEPEVVEVDGILHTGEGVFGMPCTMLYPDGSRATATYDVQAEHAVNVYVNGILTMKLVCSPDHLPELVVGRLYSEGMIGSYAEVESITVAEGGTRVLVLLRDRSADLTRKRVDTVSTCCTFNRTLNSYFVEREAPAKLAPLAWDPAWVFALATEYEADSPMHRRTFGAHSCRLSLNGQTLYVCEDLGRHNALDKVVGCALRDGVDLGKCVAFTTGRVPTDMALKAIRAGIPVMVSKAVPSDLAVQMAREFGLTLVCCAHSDSARIFNDASALEG